MVFTSGDGRYPLPARSTVIAPKAYSNVAFPRYTIPKKVGVVAKNKPNTGPLKERYIASQRASRSEPIRYGPRGPLPPLPPLKTNRTGQYARGTSGGVGGVGSGAGGAYDVGATGDIAAPVVPTFDRNADSTYLEQIALLDRALNEFKAKQTLDTTNYETGYNQNLSELGKSQETEQKDLLEDYGARGLADSGLYGTALQDLLTQYANRKTSYGNDRKTFLDNLAATLTGYQTEQEVERKTAESEALRRFNEKYAVV